MHLEGLIAELFASQQFTRDVRITDRRHQGWEPIHSGDDAVLYLSGGNLAWPAYDRRHAEAAFKAGTLAAGERGLPTIRPGEVLSAVVGREDDDRVVIQTVVFEISHHRADDVVELRHTGFLDAPTVFRRAHRFIFLGQMRYDMHARRVKPDKERLRLLPRLVDECQSLVADDLIDGFHVLLDVWHWARRQRAFVDDFLLADLAPAWVDRRVVHIAGHGGHQVARSDFIQESRWVVAMERVLHRIEMVQVAPELVEAVHRRQEFVQVAQMVFAELTGRISHRFENVRDSNRLIGDAKRCPGLSDCRKAGAKRQFASDEVRPSGGATRFRIIVGKA